MFADMQQQLSAEDSQTVRLLMLLHAYQRDHHNLGFWLRVWAGEKESYVATWGFGFGFRLCTAAALCLVLYAVTPRLKHAFAHLRHA